MPSRDAVRGALSPSLDIIEASRRDQGDIEEGSRRHRGGIKKAGIRLVAAAEAGEKRDAGRGDGEGGSLPFALARFVRGRHEVHGTGPVCVCVCVCERARVIRKGTILCARVPFSGGGRLN